MASDLKVAFHGGGLLLKIHSLQNSVLPEALLKIENGGLNLMIPFTDSWIGEKAVLVKLFRKDMGGGKGHTTDVGIGINDLPVKS